MPALAEPSTPRLDRRSPVPLHAQLQAVLMQRISRGELKPHEAIPSEAELTQAYNLSRYTVRHAIATLIKEGYLYRVRGRGTFVSRPREHFDLVRLRSFTEEMRARGASPGTRVLGLEVIEPEGQVAIRLGLTSDMPAWRISRLRLADGEPMCIQTSHIPQPLAPSLSLDDLEGTSSLYELLETRFNLVVAEADELIEAVLAWDEEARLLGIQPGAPLVSREVTSYTKTGQPIEFSTTLYRADRYALAYRSSRD